MATIYIDGIPHTVDASDNLLKALLSLGIDVPYFCYHPALGSIGSCRLCAIKKFRDANDKVGRIVMSCMEPAIDGSYISVNDEDIKNFRASVIEGLMTNHPHDCPICDEGGECHLQDMVVMTGHNYRRYEHKKRTYQNQNLGPLINHEMNRCIQCYRCVRYYKDYAGGKDLGVFGAHNHLYFGRFEDGTLENEFSGNLVEVCPTGVFTDKTLKKHYTRKWDLTNAPSVCAHCAVGCNTILGERYGSFRRTLNRFNPDVNGYFLCDRGRFGYEYLNSEKRLKKSSIKFNGSFTEISNDDAIVKAAQIINSGKTIGIGSPRASLEANYAIQKLVGKDKFFAGVEEAEFAVIQEVLSIYQSGGYNILNLAEIEKADAVLVLGEDITNTAPRAALSVRQSIKNKQLAIAAKVNVTPWNNAAVKNAAVNAKGPLFVATPYATKTDEVATSIFRGAPADISRLGYAVAASVHSQAPSVTDLSGDTLSLAKNIASTLKGAKSVAVITGVQLKSKEIIQAAANVVQSLVAEGIQAGIYCVVPENNSMGLGLLTNQPLSAAFAAIETGEAENIIVLENDLYRRADAEKIDIFLAKAKEIIVLDSIQTPLTEMSTLTLAAASFGESEGTLVNIEGRAQRYFSVMPPKENMQSWRWAKEIADKAGKSFGLKNFDSIMLELSNEVSAFAGLKEVAPLSDYKIGGMPVPRQTPRFSGRTSMNANINVSEPKPAQDENSPLVYSMEGYKGVLPSPITSYYWSPGWNSVQSTNKYLQELNSVLKSKEPGIYLFPITGNNHKPFFTNIPTAFHANGELLFVPVNQIFGSDELSALAPGIAQLIKGPAVYINSETLNKSGVSENSTIVIEVGGKEFKYIVKKNDSIPTGVAGVTVEQAFYGLPAVGKIK